MKGPCGYSLREEEQSSGLWGLGIKQRNKSLWKPVVHPRMGRRWLLLFLQDDYKVRDWLPHGTGILIQFPPCPSLENHSSHLWFSLFSASFLLHYFSGLFLLWKIDVASWYGLLKIAIADNLVIVTQDQFKWNSYLEHFQWEPRHYVYQEEHVR